MVDRISFQFTRVLKWYCHRQAAVGFQQNNQLYRQDVAPGHLGSNTRTENKDFYRVTWSTTNTQLTPQFPRWEERFCPELPVDAQIRDIKHSIAYRGFAQAADVSCDTTGSWSYVSRSGYRGIYLHWKKLSLCHWFLIGSGLSAS